MTIAALVLLLVYQHLFGVYLPTDSGTLGHDFALVLPRLLDGTFWHLRNGWFSVPWFTPSLCGGVPNLGNPDGSHYSWAQLLAMFVDPVLAVQLTMLTFAALGFVGAYLLSRRVFRISVAGSMLAAAVFMFNGFFAHRMVIGHVTFHGFMLVPFACLLLLDSARPGRLLSRLAYPIGAGILFAYMAYSGLVHTVLPSGIAILMIVGLFVWRQGGAGPLLPRLGIALAVGVALAAARLSAALAFMRWFPRDHYPLPGAESVWASIELALRALFIAPPTQRVVEVMRNTQWRLGRHELEAGVTLVPLLFIAAGLAFWQRPRPSASSSLWARLGALSLLVALCAIPIAVNVYTPAWNDLLKSLPAVGSSSTLVRWWCSYIPLIAVAAGLALDRMSERPRVRLGLAAAGVLAVVVLQGTGDRQYYSNQTYQPEAISNAWFAAQAGSIPAVSAIGTRVEGTEGAAPWLSRNDLMTQGQSQLACYYPIFGYRLERFPRKSLHSGPVLDVQDGVLNLKNPACYLYPEENGCAPGDHFRVDEREQAARFANYEPFEFEVSMAQRIANVTTLTALVGLVLFLLAWSFGAARARLRARAK